MDLGLYDYLFQFSEDEPNVKKRLLDELKATLQTNSHADLDTTVEIRQYFTHQPSLDEEKDALLFWKNHNVLYPHLSILAREYLGIPSSSVAVESMFSTTGLILNSRRFSLNPINMNMTVFIHDNISLINI